MKKVIIAGLISIFLISCSKDSSENSQASDPASKKPIKSITTTPSGYSETITYEYNGNLLTKATINGAEALFSYNSDNRLEKITAPNLETHYFTYTDNRLTKIEIKIGTKRPTVYTYFYNDVNQIIKSVLDTQLPKLFEYDKNGNISKVTEGGGYAITLKTYDDKNHPFKNVITQLESFEDYNVLLNNWYGNYVNNFLTVKNQNSNIVFSYEYDSDNFPTKRIWKKPNGTILRTTTYEYN